MPRPPASTPEDLHQDRLETRLIVTVKGRRAFGVNIENSDQPSLAIDHRNDDLTGRAAVAGDVAREGVDIRHELGRSRFGGDPADAAPKCDPQAAKRPLIG